MRGLKLGLGIGAQRASGGGGGATAPAAMTVGQWTLADSPSVGGDKVVIDIDAAPSDGGSVITKYQFKVDPGTWQDLASGAALGPRTVTVLAGTLASVQVRAVNAVGNGAASDTKSVTPTALAGPTNSVAPAITGIMAVGETATRSNGTWSVTPDEYQTEWFYGATLIVGATASTYLIEDYTFNAVLSCRVRVRQTAGAWSDWVTATGGGTVEADAQDMVWEAEYTSYDPSNPRSMTTPAVTAGDCLVFLVKAAAGSIALPFQQADFNIGTLRAVPSTQGDGEALALVTYVCPTSEAGGVVFTAGHRNGVEISGTIVNIGPHTFSSATAVAMDGASGSFDFPAITAPRNGKVFYGVVSRNGFQMDLTPNPPNPAGGFPASENGNYTDNAGATIPSYWCRTVTSPGTVATQTAALGYYLFHKHVIATFTPQVVNPAPPAGKYIADSNGAGIARTSTISTMVSDGVTINLSASRKVGNYISNNQGLGTLFIYDAGAGVTISSHTGSVLWKNPHAIVEGSGGQPFVNESGMSGPSYNAGLASASPVSLVAGDVAVISVNQSPAINQSYVSKYIFVHVVGTLPYDDEFAPPYLWDASLGARPRFRFSDWNQGTRPLPSYTAESNAPSLSTVAQAFDRRTFDIANNWNTYNITATLHPANYGRTLLLSEWDAMYALCANYTVAQKTPMLVGFLQRGIDNWGAYKTIKAQSPTAIYHRANGGQGQGRKMAIIFAGYMLGNNAMRDIDATAAEADFQEDGHHAYITQGIIDHTQGGGWDGGAVFGGTGSHAYVQGMLNGNSLNYPMPEWCADISPASGNTFSLANWNGKWDAHVYRINGDTFVRSPYSGQVLLAAGVGLDTYFGNDAWFDYAKRFNNIQRYGVDPWILAGGGVARYTMVDGAPSVADRAPSAASDGWGERMYWANIAAAWPYPW